MVGLRCRRILEAQLRLGLPEDAEIIRYASDFLIRARDGKPKISRAVDVGAGTNLYPALMMLPWIERLVFTEYAPTNIDWLAANLADEPGEWAWQPFWSLVANLPGYRDVEQPRRRLAGSHEIRLLSVFDLPRQAWDLGRVTPRSLDELLARLPVTGTGRPD